LELLLREGADIDAATHDGVTPLHVAAENGHYKILELLIESGANVNAADSSGQTALHYTARQFADRGGYNYSDELRLRHEGVAAAWLLFGHGAIVDQCDNSRWTPLEVAVQTGRIGLARTLLIAKKHEDYGCIGYDYSWLWEELEHMDEESWRIT
jgi:hypothetical protein